jgi:hypothetical protein
MAPRMVAGPRNPAAAERALARLECALVLAKLLTGRIGEKIQRDDVAALGLGGFIAR